ncbi:MAG: GGDEF domain-containing protein [Treponema sp.]|nr:GGDEF domain-containing protein [Treponema sp.]
MCASSERSIAGRPAAQVFSLFDGKTLSNILKKKLLPGRCFDFKDAVFKAGGNNLIVDGSITALSAGGSAGHQPGGGYVIITRDVSEKKKLHAYLDYQVSHDTLTGLPNREGFVVRLDDLLDTVKRSGGVHSLMQINIDNFKRVTDESGRAGANAVLIQFAEMLKSLAGMKDIPARLSSDIFALLYNSGGSGEAAALSERIHETVKNYKFAYDGKIYPLTVSIGIVPITKKAAFAEGLLAEAERICAAAKKIGGDTTAAA